MYGEGVTTESGDGCFLKLSDETALAAGGFVSCALLESLPLNSPRSSIDEADDESECFINTEGAEVDGVVAAVETSYSDSRDDVEDAEEGGVCERGACRDRSEAAPSSATDCTLLDRSVSGDCEGRNVVENDSVVPVSKLSFEFSG